MNGLAAPVTTPPAGRQGPPRWLIASTAALALLSLLMAVAETTLWIHFVVDRGEAISLVGLGFILVAGLAIHRQGRLWSSLPLVLPWVLYPVVTQGDQLIDHLSINQMRLITHLILALMFAAPVAVIVLAATSGLTPAVDSTRSPRRWTRLVPGLRLIEAGRTVEGATLLALLLLLIEAVIAHYFLGTLMLLTVAVLAISTLAWADSALGAGRSALMARVSRERAALAVLLVSVALSLGLYVAFKNRPGAYQGSPHAFHDPSQRDAVYPAAAIAVPATPATGLPPEALTPAAAVLSAYGQALEDLLAAYYVMDRNYNYWFHNELFLRNTPVAAGFRQQSLARIESVRHRVAETDAQLRVAVAAIPASHPLSALLAEAEAYTHFSLRRATVLEQMSARFERTKAGLQHATHLYEGEGKMLGSVLAAVLVKHGAVLEAPPLAVATAPFAGAARRVQQAYANRIVGF